MECNHKGQMKHLGQWLTYSCGQCLPCRIKKQSSWELRNRLEYQMSLSSSFLTLTISDNNMHKWASRPPNFWLRRFFDALRKLESRHGNQNQIRYFGCLEYGETFGRPHYHLLVYNQVNSLLVPTPRSNGIPSCLIQLKQWPHGHVDVGTVTTSSIRYVASYLLKDNSRNPPILFRTSRPGIGASGICKLAESAVNKLGKCVPMPTYFQIGERKFPLLNWERKTYAHAIHDLGAKIIELSPHEKTLQRLSHDTALTQSGAYEASAKKQQALMEAQALDVQRQTAKEIQITSIYNRLAVDDKLAAIQTPAYAS